MVAWHEAVLCYVLQMMAIWWRSLASLGISQKAGLDIWSFKDEDFEARMFGIQTLGLIIGRHVPILSNLFVHSELWTFAWLSI